MVAVVTASSIIAGPASAAPTCFGRRATIVGTNRDPSRSVEVSGTSRNDVIVGLRGGDIISGRGGDDLICSGGGDDYIKAGGGNDKVRGQEGLDTIFGGGRHDRLWGGAGGGDTLLGGTGNDRLIGGPGTEDRLLGGRGDDVVDGGAGYDIAEFWDSPAGVEADLRTGSATGHGEDRMISIEGLVGSNLDDVVYGDELSNMLEGGGGSDLIHAFGSTGDGGTDILRSGGGDDLLDGGEGPDVVSYNITPWAVTADLAAGTTTTDGFGNDTLVGIEHLTGSKENDTLIGNDEDNIIIGNGGDDIMDGGGGIDEIAFLESRMPVVADLGAGTADADWWGSDTFVNFENLIGSVWRDTLVGDDGPNLIWGGNRNDSLSGIGGDDVLIGHLGTDSADGGDGTDECDAEVENNCEAEPSTAVVLGRSSGRLFAGHWSL